MSHGTEAESTSRIGSGGRHELISLADRSRWERALAEVPHGHAHTWGFCRAVQLTTELPTFMYRFEAHGVRVICPLSERRFADEVDIVTPQGFGGFIGTGPWRGFAQEWAAFARSQGWVCAYIALNPLVADAEGFPRTDVHAHNHLYAMDLGGSADNVRARMGSNRRRQLRDWPRIEERLVLDRQRLTQFLLEQYAPFFARRGAGPATDYAASTIRAVANLDDVLAVGILGDEGEIEAVAVFGHGSHTADYLINVSLPGATHHSAFLVWAGVEWARSLGLEHLNLGGGISPGDGVAEFKRRFGAVALPLVSLHQVFRPDVYQRLVLQAGVTAQERYFPAYRARSPP